MRVLYCDASAIAKLVLPEPESAALETFLGDRPIASSALAIVEVARAAMRAPHPEAALDRARAVLAAVDLLPLDDSILRRAGSIGPPSLRSLDAIHLSAALTLGARLEFMVVYDRLLSAAATAAGLPTISPS